MNEQKSLRLHQSLMGFFAILVLILIDQITKYFAVIKLKGQNPLEIISGVFELHYLENRGAAFGILQGKKTFFIISTVIIVILLICLYLRLPVEKRFHFMRLILILFISGAIGNFIDRSVHDYVIDFFYFKLIDFPIFNVADIYVTTAAITLLITFFFYYKEEDIDVILPDIFRKKNNR